jgi:hypothetical protein
MTEVVLFVKGSFDIGFEINGKKIYAKRFHNSSSSASNCGAIIGGYGVSFKKRARYIYKTASRCSGYFIRKKNWHEVMDKNDFIRDSFYQQVERDFIRITAYV